MLPPIDYWTMSIKYVQTLGIPLWRRRWNGPSVQRRFPQTLCSPGSWWRRACISPQCPKRPTPPPRPSCLTTHARHSIELIWVRSKFRLICIRCGEMDLGSPTLWAGDDPWGEDVSASQNSTATLSADHNLWAELLHSSGNKSKRSILPHYTHASVCFLNSTVAVLQGIILNYLGLTEQANFAGMYDINLFLCAQLELLNLFFPLVRVLDIFCASVWKHPPSSWLNRAIKGKVFQ